MAVVGTCVILDHPYKSVTPLLLIPLSSLPLYAQWKNAPKGQLMDSKLRCVFIEGEAPAASTQKAEERPATPVRCE